MNTSIAIFFFLLFFGLLLGDGKQGTIEVYGVSVLIVCWVYYAFKKKHIRHIPKTLGLPWVVFGVSAAISTILSDSAGLSLSWMIRLASGYLIYRLFYSMATKETASATAKSLLVFAAGASLLSLLAMVFPPLRNILPSMNLVDVRFGHNHLADLLVFVAPIVVSLIYFSRQSKLGNVIVTIGFIFLLMLTYARGAWFIIATYGAVVYALRDTQERRKRALTVGIAVLLIAIFSYGYARVFTTQRPTQTGGAAVSRVTRPLTFESRLEYWRQAIQSIKERPAFGSGPGTFSLTSTRLQNRVNQSSWFAHSTLLQTGSETGMFGLLAFLWLIGAHVYLYITHRRAFMPGKPETALLWGLVLTFVYSLFEYVLDYQVIWLLFWSTMGFTAGIVRTDNSRVSASHVSIALPLASIALFYLLWILSGFVALTTKRYDFAFYIAPFDAGNALVMLNTQDVTQADPNIALLRVFHKNNPEVLKEFAEYYSKRDQDEIALEIFSRVIMLDPKNIEGYALYDEAARRARHPLSFVDQTQLLMNGFLPREYSQQLTALATRYRVIDVKADWPSIDLRQLSEYTIEEPIAKAIYLIGSYLVTSDKEAALSFWELSSRIDPDLSFYAVERANLLAQEGRLDEALAVLNRCRTNKYARIHCGAFRQQLVDKIYLPVGFFTQYMREFLPTITYEKTAP